MNLRKLKAAERVFLDTYPGGFMHPAMQALKKKHKADQMFAMAQECFAPKKFSGKKSIAGDMVKVVTRSSMVSVFEKPRFRDTVKAMSGAEIDALAGGLKALLHGNQQRGFEKLLSVLEPLNLAKWTLLTVVPNYYRPSDEVFIKPTTVKGVIEHFELEGLSYSAKPTWAFYAAYREALLEMKSRLDPCLSPSNAAFSGFLMMTCDSCGTAPALPAKKLRMRGP